MKNIDSDLQKKNIEWWDQNPMSYDWDKTLEEREGTKEFFQAIDERFFNALKIFAHPEFPNQVPFSELIDYKSLVNKNVLEVGCGLGGNAAILAKEGVNLNAIDITPGAVDLCKKRFDLFSLKGDISLGDAENLHFADDEFEFIWSWGVIHHTANMQNAVDEIRRVLKPGGIAKIMVYHRNSFRYWILGGLYYGIIKGRLFRMSINEVNKSFTDGFIVRHLTKREARRMFSKFKKIRLRVMDQGESVIPSPKINRVLDFLLPFGLNSKFQLFLMRRFGWFLFIEAEK
ncbi:MAG: methyltransferase domain-containing protein [Actinobacteria bacterium]|nr:methyltransferase domain-containing protein [Actinomycetota bacterium]